MKSVDEALNTPASELINAARSPATTSPRTPTGRMVVTRSGKAACAAPGIRFPSASTIWPSAP